jgi:hypothetical protein
MGLYFMKTWIVSSLLFVFNKQIIDVMHAQHTLCVIETHFPGVKTTGNVNWIFQIGASSGIESMFRTLL